MKKGFLYTLILVLATGILYAQNDTMYIMKSGQVIGSYNTAEIDSIIFYRPPEKGVSIQDIDGNEYETVRIGNQTWMAENLRTTRYADGTPIPRVEGDENWAALSASSGAYCWYDDDSTKHAGTYGALYTWAAAMNGAPSSTAVPSGIQGICPDGWHLPSAEEWAVLEKYLIQGGYNYDGSKEGNKIGKSLAATMLWFNSSVEGSVGNTDYPIIRNRTGFSALPGGYRDSFGKFNYIGNETFFWSSTEFSTTSSRTRSLSFYSKELLDTPPLCYYKQLAFSVRCLSD